MQSAAAALQCHGRHCSTAVTAPGGRPADRGVPTAVRRFRNRPSRWCTSRENVTGKGKSAPVLYSAQTTNFGSCRAQHERTASAISAVISVPTDGFWLCCCISSEREAQASSRHRVRPLPESITGIVFGSSNHGRRRNRNFRFQSNAHRRGVCARRYGHRRFLGAGILLEAN